MSTCLSISSLVIGLAILFNSITSAANPTTDKGIANEVRSLKTDDLIYVRDYQTEAEPEPATQSAGDSDSQRKTLVEERLYDLKNDPDQTQNVAAEKKYESDLKRLRRQLVADLIRSVDPIVDVEGYTSREIEGWPVRVSNRLLENKPTVTARAIELLTDQLREIQRLLPASSLAKVRNVPIWMSPKYKNARPTGCYHPNARWLKEQGRHPDLLQCVEFTTIEIFEREIRRMPMMVLHELAHAYHDQEFGFQNREIKSVFNSAKKEGLYDNVLRSNGRYERAYAITNQMEYFAETTEAYFGINDFYPFRKPQLKEHDPAMFEMLENVWGVERE